MSRRMRVLALLSIALHSVAWAQGKPTHSGDFRVIINPANTTTSVDRKMLTDMFLKRVTRWPSGDVVRPVDLQDDSATRKRFTQEVLARSVSAVKSYWQQSIFAGRDVPPAELDSDEAVVNYVLKNPGAIGYVSATTDVGSVKVLPIQ